MATFVVYFHFPTFFQKTNLQIQKWKDNESKKINEYEQLKAISEMLWTGNKGSHMCFQIPSELKLFLRSQFWVTGAIIQCISFLCNETKTANDL